MIAFAVERPVLCTCYLITMSAVLTVALDIAHGAWTLWRCEKDMRQLQRARRVTGSGNA